MLTGILGLFLIALFGGLGIAACVFWIWMLIHAITNKGLDSVEKLIFVIVILCLHFIGGLIYFFIGRPKAAGAFS